MACTDNLVSFGQRVNDFLKRKIESLPDEPKELKQAMAYALLQGGKRVRPYLVYTVGREFNASVYQLDYPAAAVECIHAYSLIHDDMPEMDNDMLRRGQPTVHAKFGAATALLAGDTLQALAFDILTDAKCTIAGEVKAQMCACLAQAAGFVGMCGGQALDLKAEHHKLTQAQLEHMHSLKTGALILCAVKLGYMTARYQEAYDNAQGDRMSQAFGFVEQPQLKREQELLTTFGKKLGLAFQVWDDVLDVAGDTATLGKTVGSDVANDKSTFVTLLGLEGAKSYAGALAQEAKAALAQLPCQSKELAAFVDFVVTRDH